MNLLSILGPTACGKTALAARVAYDLDGEVISADSRQVYRRMDIGTGKDYGDYLVNGVKIPVHLTDIAEPGDEYNIYSFQKDFTRVFDEIQGRGKLPILCGGSGMYLEAVLKGYRLAESSQDEGFLDSLDRMTDPDLAAMLRSYKTLHNSTDLEDRPRMIKALLIAHQERNEHGEPHRDGFHPDLQPLVFGVTFPRGLVRARITERLRQRLASGMVEEVRSLLEEGIPSERLIRYGLEYRFITRHILGELTYEQMFTGLNTAIHQFSKRQMTWFRRMERQGIEIHWLDGRTGPEEMLQRVMEEVKRES